MNVGLRPAAGRLEVCPSSGVRLAVMDVDLPEAVGSQLLFSIGGAQGRDHEVPEPLGVEDRRPVWFILIKYERQRGHVRVSPAERLRNVDLQTVDLEEVILVREDDESPGLRVLLLLDVLPDSLLQGLRDSLIVHGVPQADQVRPPLVLRDVGVDAQVSRENRSRPTCHGGYRLPEILSLGHAWNTSCLYLTGTGPTRIPVLRVA